MAQFQITLSFDSEVVTPEQAAEQLEAFQKMTEALTHEELMVTADFMANNPEGMAQLKSWIHNPPVIIQKVTNMLFK